MEKQNRLLKTFISYAHNDKLYFEIFINGIKRHAKISNKFVWEFWDDTSIYVGSIWDTEIQENIRKADVALLLISESFLNSDYIEKKEFNSLIQRLNNDNNVLIFPILLAPANFHNWSDLANFQIYMPKGDEFGKATIKDFTYADLVKFRETDGLLIPNVNLERYHLNLFANLEKSAEKYFENKLVLNDINKVQDKDLIQSLLNDFNKERSQNMQIIQNLTEQITLLNNKIDISTAQPTEKQALKNRILKFISEGKTTEAIEIFLNYCQTKNDKYGLNSIILLSGRYRQLDNEHNMNTLSFDQYKIELSKINSALLEMTRIL